MGNSPTERVAAGEVQGGDPREVQGAGAAAAPTRKTALAMVAAASNPKTAGHGAPRSAAEMTGRRAEGGPTAGWGPQGVETGMVSLDLFISFARTFFSQVNASS